MSTIDVGLDPASLKTICHIPRAGYTDLTWYDDGRLYFLLGGPGNLMYAGHGVYAVDPEASSPEYKHVAFGEDYDAVGISKTSNGEIVVRLEHGLESRIALLSGKMLYRRQEELEAFDVRIYSDEDDIDGLRAVVAVATSNLNNPAEVYTTNAAHGSPAGANDTMIKLSNHGHRFTNHTFGTCTILSVPSNDGAATIDAMYLSPPTSSPQPLPTVTLIHGGPNTRLAPSFIPFYYHWSAALLSHNYAVLLPNYRGSSGRGRAYAAWSHDHPTEHAYADVLACKLRRDGRTRRPVSSGNRRIQPRRDADAVGGCDERAAEGG